KGQATTARFDTILAELRRATQASEDVKAAIAGGLWLEQQRWNQRRDVYWDVLKSLVDVNWTSAAVDRTLAAFDTATREAVEARRSAEKGTSGFEATARAAENQDDEGVREAIRTAQKAIRDLKSLASEAEGKRFEAGRSADKA